MKEIKKFMSLLLLLAMSAGLCGNIPVYAAEETEVPEFNIAGSVLENVVSNDGVYSQWNIGEREVVVLVEDDHGTKSNTTVTVPDHSASYPEEWFPTVSEPNAKPEVIPTIQEWYGYEGSFTLTADSTIIINDAAGVGLDKIAKNMQTDVEEISGITLAIKEGKASGRANDIYIESLTDTDKYDLGEEGYLMVTNENGIQIYAPAYTGCIFGTITVEQILWMDDAHLNVPQGIMRDYPAYEVRGIKLDIARTPYRYEQLQDYAKIMLWYKMSEYDLHINDNDNANISDATSESHSGFHRLESETFPSLISETKHVGIPEELVNEDYYNNNEDYQGNPTYTKKQWRDLAALTEDYGMYMLTEIDLPGHSLLYNKYAAENPDNIKELEGGTSYTGNGIGTKGGIELLDLLGTNSSRALWFAQALWDEYTGGDEPAIYGDIVHIGADEYWDHSTAGINDKFAVFADTMRQVIQENLGEDTKVRMWGASLTSFSTAKSALQMTTEELAANYQLDIWHTSYENPAARIAEGYEIVNCRDAYVYGNPGRTNRDVPNAEYLFHDWNPSIFGGNNPLLGEPNLLGAKAVIWGDQSQEGMTEKDIHERVLQAIAIISEKTWNGTDEDDTFAEWEIRKSHLAEGPGTQIAMKVESESSLVLDYDFANISADGKTIYDASGNGYDGAVTGGSVKDGWMTFHGETLIETGLQTLSYPYTVSFDLKLSEADGRANTKESSLLSGYDGRIQVAGHDGSLSADVNYFTRDFDYVVPTDGTKVNVTLVGTLHGTKLYVDGEPVTYLSQKADADGLQGAVTTLYSSVLLPLEKIGQDFNGQMANLKVYNKAFSAEEVADAYAGIDDGKVNVAQDTHAGSDSYESGDAFDDGVQRTRVSMKTIDGDAFEVNETATAQPDTTTSDIYSYWQGDHADSALTIDLGVERQISEINIQWRYGGKGKDMQILTSSDGENWTISKTITGNTDFFQTVTFDEAVDTRYIRVQGVSSNSASGIYMIQELMAYEKVDKEALGTVLTQAEAIVEENALGFENGTKAGKNLYQAVVFAQAMEENPLAAIDEINEAEAKLIAAIEAFAEETREVIRLKGADRYGTSFAVAEEYKEVLGVEEFDAVIVATGLNFADALSGSYLAAQKKAPILLTEPGKEESLISYVKDNLKAGGTVYLLGGTGVVSQKLQDALKDFSYDVKRLAGKDRYITNLEILKEAGITGNEILVATGEAPYDSLSASATNLPILLVKEKLTEAQKEVLAGLPEDGKIRILGGEGAVSEEIEDKLHGYSDDVVRVKGTNRYETSVAVAKTFFGEDAEKVTLAYGESFPDGLCGGPLAAEIGAPVLLVKMGGTDKAAAYAVNAASGYVFGGTGVVGDETVKAVLGEEITIIVRE